MPRTLALYLHPVAALTTIALGGYAASLGVRSRMASPGAEAARRRHAAIGPWLYAAVLLNWFAGLATVRWLRPELDAATSGHFIVGSALVAAFTAAALVSRRVRADPRARTIHPLLGAAALLLSGVQIFLGLQLLP